MYEIYQAEDDPTWFHFFELFDDMTAVDAHRDSEHVQRFVAQVASWLAGPAEGVNTRKLLI